MLKLSGCYCILRAITACFEAGPSTGVWPYAGQRAFATLGVNLFDKILGTSVDRHPARLDIPKQNSGYFC